MPGAGHFFQIALPAGVSPHESEPADAVRSFVFSANLAAQEACGDAAASTSPQRVLNRLQGSTESATYLFGLSPNPVLAPAGRLGLPVVSACEPSPEVDCDGFIHLTLPLLEEVDHAELDCVLSPDFLPLPGQPLDPEGVGLTRRLASQALELSAALGRHVVQTGLLHPPGAPAGYDPMEQAYGELGFVHKHSQRQLMVAVPDNPPVPYLQAGVDVHVWPDYDIPEVFIDQVLRLLTVASTDAHHGDLATEPIQWTRQRLREAHARLRDRRAHTLLVALEDSGTLVALSELSRLEHADPEVAEWTLTVTHRDRRREGLALSAKRAALLACARHWPDVARTYTSVAADDAAMTALGQRLGARTLSVSEDLELRLPGAGEPA